MELRRRMRKKKIVSGIIMPIPKQMRQIPSLASLLYAAITIKDTIDDAVKPDTIARLVDTATSNPRFFWSFGLTSADSIACHRLLDSLRVRRSNLPGQYKLHTLLQLQCQRYLS